MYSYVEVLMLQKRTHFKTGKSNMKKDQPYPDEYPGMAGLFVVPPFGSYPMGHPF